MSDNNKIKVAVNYGDNSTNTSKKLPTARLSSTPEHKQIRKWISFNFFISIFFSSS